MMKKSPVIVMMGLAFAATLSASATSPRASQNLAKVITATPLGGTGNEWLSAGGVLKSGQFLVCGVTLEAEAELLGALAKVQGTDQKALPPVREWEKMGETDTGVMKAAKVGNLDDVSSGFDMGMRGDLMGLSLEAPKTKEELKKEARANQKKLRSISRHYQWKVEDETGAAKISYKKLHWAQKEATGFWAVFDSDLKQIEAFYRLPRGAGSITDAKVAADGSVYLTGAATSRIRKWSKPIRIENVPNPKGVNNQTFGTRKTYLAKLTPDTKTVVWMVEIDGWSIPPKLFLLNDGNIAVHGPGVRTYTPQGQFVSGVGVENTRVLGGLAVSPLNGEFTRVGDWMSPTGREPYRTPRLVVLNPDGSIKKDLISWRGPFAGVDAFRLVADSAVRKTAYHTDGSMVYSSWSHGGNNVMFRYPYDIETRIPNSLGYQSMETCATVVKLDKDHNLVNAFIWKGYNVHDLDVAVDGSLLAITDSGRVQENLPNNLGNVSEGLAVFITDPNLDAVRFYSCLPAVGQRVVLSGCDQRTDAFNFATGISKGRPVALVFSSTMKSLSKPAPGGKTVEHGFPTKSPLQQSYGGGLSDGYLVALDLSAEKPFEGWQPPERKKGPKKPHTDPVVWPQNGQQFRVGVETYKNGHITFRDEGRDMWPSFFYGGPKLGGKFSYDEDNPMCDLIVDCPRPLLAMGEQDQKVLGELISFSPTGEKDKKGNPVSAFDHPVQLRLTAIRDWKNLPKTQLVRIGGVHCPQAEAKVDGILHVGNRHVKITDAYLRAAFKVPKGVDPLDPDVMPNHVLVTVKFSVLGGDIGLTGDLKEETLQVSSRFSAYSSGAPKSGW